MKELVEMIVKALVDSPEEVVIREIEGPKTRILEIKVAKKDIGKVLGKKGRNIAAIRSIASAAGKGKRHCVIELLEGKPF